MGPGIIGRLGVVKGVRAQPDNKQKKKDEKKKEEEEEEPEDLFEQVAVLPQRERL